MFVSAKVHLQYANVELIARLLKRFTALARLLSLCVNRKVSRCEKSIGIGVLLRHRRCVSCDYES